MPTRLVGDLLPWPHITRCPVRLQINKIEKNMIDYFFNHIFFRVYGHETKLKISRAQVWCVWVGVLWGGVLWGGVGGMGMGWAWFWVGGWEVWVGWRWGWRLKASTGYTSGGSPGPSRNLHLRDAHSAILRQLDLPLHPGSSLNCPFGQFFFLWHPVFLHLIWLTRRKRLELQGEGSFFLSLEFCQIGSMFDEDLGLLIFLLAFNIHPVFITQIAPMSFRLP